MPLGVEAEARHVVLSGFGADRLQDPDRDYVLRLREGRAHAHRALELAVVVLRLPALAARLLRLQHDRLVGHHGGGGEPLLEGRRIDERLERRAWLPPSLRDVVEAVAPEVEAP